ncbi:MAG: hypothetical protein K0Q59_1831 [Paenibacillus sp.]|jgi:hypothetical protein|nr:hypothetical protein [Paenibacillus sp.]
MSWIQEHWRSLLLIAGLAVAGWFVHKHKAKFSKNEFE